MPSAIFRRSVADSSGRLILGMKNLNQFYRKKLPARVFFLVVKPLDGGGKGTIEYLSALLA